LNNQLQESNEALIHLRQAITDGTHWYVAMLEAIELWELEEERVNGKHYHYLIGGEAFDLLLLAKRLLMSADGLIPANEKSAFIKNNQLPMQITQDEVKDLIGETKHKAHLNYFYGVRIERALLWAVQKQVNKELGMYPCCQDPREFEGVHRRIYGKTVELLLDKFFEDSAIVEKKNVDAVGDSDEFTYWLFKYRLKNSDKERIASDTQKGLQNLSKKQNPALWT
jgi:hypothetical protein